MKNSPRPSPDTLSYSVSFISEWISSITSKM
uniref:Uncharacterized protein n=1 Tax=Anguilla anguilla TaxID=7936 RepID=A0A0E9Q137_ANGAN